MAYRRSLSTRASLYARQRFPSFSYAAIHDDSERKKHSLDDVLPQPKVSNFVQQRFMGSSLNGSAGFGAFFGNKRCSHFSPLPGIGSSLCRYMSTGEGSGNVESGNDVVGVISETVQEVASQAPAVNEVAVAAADSFFNVAAVQHAIDTVHSLTGFNWWASIALTVFLVRTATLPFHIQMMRADTRIRAVVPQIRGAIKELSGPVKEYFSKGKGGSVDHLEELQVAVSGLCKECAIPMFLGHFIQTAILTSFFFAISNMAEKVPSFQNGGASWFIDLSTRDSSCVLPIVTALTFMIVWGRQVDGSPKFGTSLMASRWLAVLGAPIMMLFPNAMFCYWIPYNIFSIIYGFAMRRVVVKKFLGLTDTPLTPASSALVAAVSSVPKKMSQLPNQPAKSAAQNVSLSSVVSQRYAKAEIGMRKKMRKSKR